MLTHRASVSRALPLCKYLLLEPGKALVQPAGVLVSKVLEVRATRLGRDVVLDASIALLPDLSSHPHRLWAACAERGFWTQLSDRGEDRIVGSICMEHDIIRPSTCLPEWIQPGHFVVVGDCGAYDTSMSFSFGRGERHGSR